MTRKDSEIWFFAVDAGRARLLQCHTVPPGRLHVVEAETLEYEPEEHEHGRPSPRSGVMGNSYASGGHEDDHQIHRFAKQVNEWIEKRLGKLPQGKVALFSAPRFLGELRKLYSSETPGRIEEFSLDLTRLTPGSLATHPAIEKLYREHSS